ncbi:unnamed protein product, partial [Brenthis ino]
MNFFFLNVLIVLTIFMSIGLQVGEGAQIERRPCRQDCTSVCNIRGRADGYCLRGHCLCQKISYKNFP